MFIYCISGWWFQTFFDFHNIWDNPSHWLSYFSRWLKPPTRYVQCVIPICTVDACCPRRIFSTDLHGRQGRTWKKLVRRSCRPGSPVVVWGTAAQIRQRHLAGPWEVIEVGGSLNQSEVAVKATEPSTLGVIYGCVFSNGEPHISKWCISYSFLWLLNGHKYSIDQIEELSLLWNSDIMWYIYIYLYI